VSDGLFTPQFRAFVSRLVSPQYRVITIVVALVVLAGGVGVRALASQEPARSAASFCKVYDQQKREYLAKYDAGNKPASNMNEAFAALGKSVQAIGDVTVIFDHLDKVAPDDIEPDVARVRDSLKQNEQNAISNAGNPLAGLASGLTTALLSSGSWQRVSGYVEAHCEPRAPAPNTATVNTPPPAAPSLAAIACLPGSQGWQTVDVTSGVAGRMLTTPGGDCMRYPTFGTGNNPAIGALYELSPDFTHLARWENPTGQANLTGGPSPGGQHAGYQSAAGGAEDNSFVDVSGASTTDFSQAAVQDSQVLFNPATGDVWWQRDAHLWSNGVLPATPVDRGAGYLYTFTPSGEPIPVPYYDSPSGNVRAVLTEGNGYYGTLNYGPASALSASCLQQAGIKADGAGWDEHVCASQSAAAAECNSNEENTHVAGWVNDTSIVCYSPSTLRVLTLEGSTVTKRIDLIPTTTQQLADALVTPDGENVLLFARSATSGLTLYSVPTDGTVAQGTPKQLGQWSGTGNAALVGWMVNGKLRVSGQG
jgi:hypothetical protein